MVVKTKIYQNKFQEFWYQSSVLKRYLNDGNVWLINYMYVNYDNVKYFLLQLNSREIFVRFYVYMFPLIIACITVWVWSGLVIEMDYPVSIKELWQGLTGDNLPVYM